MIKTLAGSIRQYKKQTIMSPVTVALEVFFEIMIPLIMAKLIDEGIDQGDMGVIWKYGLILLAVAMISLFCGAISGKFAAQASSGFAKNLRQDIYYKVQEFSFANIDKFSTASLVTRMTTDITNIQMAFQMIIRIAVRSPIMLVCALFAAFKIDAQLSLIYVITVPILGIGLYGIIMKVHPIFERVFKTYDRLNAIVQENLYGIRVVKSFTREDHEVGKFDQVSDNIYKNFVKAEQILAFNMPLMQLAVYTCMLLICWLGAKAIVACGGDEALGLSTGEFMSLFTYTMQILMSLMMLSMVFVMIIMARASAERVCEVLSEESTLKNPDNPVCEVKDGDMGGIIRHTGSGKSTLIQHFNGLLKPTSGSVYIDGERLWDDKSRLRPIRFKVGLVFQYPEYQLFEETCYKDIAFGPKNRGIKEEQIDKYVKEAARMVGLSPEILDKSPFELSGGQKRRVAIAGVMAMNPKVLILDEPASGLDPKGREQILGLIREYHEQMKNTVLLVSHSMEDIAKNVSKILVMNESKLFCYDDTVKVFHRSEELVSMGLAVPQITRVINRLKAMGIDIKDDVYTVGYAKKVILEMLEQEKNK